MSLKYISSSNVSHFSMLPHSMAGNTNFSDISSLKPGYASKVQDFPDYLSVSKQNNSNGIQESPKSDILEKSQNLVSQTVSSNINGNCSTEESPATQSLSGVQSFHSCKNNNEIPAVNEISIRNGIPSKISSNGAPKQNGSTEDSSVTKISKSSRPLGLGIVNKKFPPISVFSLTASTLSRTVSNNSTFQPIFSWNSNRSALSGENSCKTEANKVLEESGSTDLHANGDSSKAVDSSGEGSRVVVQTLSNVSCGQESLLDSYFNINEILEKKPCAKKWSPGHVIESWKRNSESSRCSMNDQEEKTSDVNHQETLTSKVSSSRRMRKNHDMNLHIRQGKGIRLRDIDHIASNIENATPSLLSFLHKVLFGSYGGSSNDDALSQTKQNILHFSGFPFPEDSEMFQIKQKCLSKVPYQMLHGLCTTLLGNGPRTRSDSVDDLLSFLQKPTSNSKRNQQVETNKETLVESDLAQLEQQAVKGPYPIIVLPKLSDGYVKELLQKMRVEPKVDSPSTVSGMETMVDDETIPEDVKTKLERNIPSNRIQLKALPKVVIRVNKARRRIINLLHTLLYGRPGSDEVNRLNILEFSGFSHYDAKTYKRKKEFLSKLRIHDLNHMCSIFSLRMQSFSKIDKVIKFLHYLKAPSLLTSRKNTAKLRPQNKEMKETTAKKTENQSECKRKSYERPIKKLKDFEKICRNIECSSPKDLTELNDLLFLKPSSNLEIHERILEFSSSSFRENSPDFHSRRTLLRYMSFEIIKKMAALLEITDWEEYKNPQDLATTLLRFLMDMKPSVKVRQRIKPRINRLRRKVSSNLTHRPHLLRVQRDDSYWENNLKGNLNTSSAIHNSSYAKEGFHEENCMQDTSVIVRRISESSYSFTDTRTNEPVTVSNSNSDESLSLYDFIKHPSDKQLEATIREMIFTNTWSSSMGDLINRVFHCYPYLNLTYRVDFIKAKALEVIHEVQNSATPFGDVI